METKNDVDLGGQTPKACHIHSAVVASTGKLGATICNEFIELNVIIYSRRPALVDRMSKPLHAHEHQICSLEVCL